MNVLIFVMTMLMLLSLMTYARLESFRDSQAFQLVFKHYMQEDERGYINIQAEKQYQTIKISEKGSKAAPKINASPRIGIALLFDKTRESKGKEWEQTKVLLKNLIKTLYENQPFYKELEATRPAFLEDLIQTLTKTIDDLPQEKKPKTAIDLANISLNDPDLDKAFYKMLHGAFYSNAVNNKTVSAQSTNLNENEFDTADDEETLNEEAAEFKSSEGYYSLLDFVSAKSKPKIRVFLASTEVLKSIFTESAIVEMILIEREALYKQALDERDPKELETVFKNQFERMKNPAIENESLNFSVSKTNPKYYK